uniref:G_PROTEIN_RECEP_F1_2 domain-containing protein n=1 Tax=Angiostrongylus cantonensis TaxID=6313 RepID=A0A158P6M4_ANGCA
LYILTHFLIPFTIMAVLNGSVIVTMWRGRQMRQMLTRQARLALSFSFMTNSASSVCVIFLLGRFQQQREQSTTVMLLIVTIVFALCNTLPFLLNVVESVFPDLFVDPVVFQRTANIAFTLNDLSNLLVVLNSATTFIVYFIFSEKYRQTLFFIIKNGCSASISDYNNYTAMSRTASMRVDSGCEIQRGGSKQSSASSGKSNVLLKPLFLQKRNDRFSSKHNERTGSYIEQIRLPRIPCEKKRKHYKLSLSEGRTTPPEIRVTACIDVPLRERQCPS